MPEMSPENLQKLLSSQVKRQTANQGMGGLTAGDKMELFAGFENIINIALSGNAKMGGKSGILDRFADLVKDYTTGVKKEMQDLFDKMFKKAKDDKDNQKDDEDPVILDEKEFKKLHAESFEKIQNSSIIKKLHVDRVKKLKTFFKVDFMNSLFKNKTFQKSMTGIKTAFSTLKTGLFNFTARALPALANLGNLLSSYVAHAYNFAAGMVKWTAGATKALGSLTRTVGLIATRMLFFGWTILTTLAAWGVSIISFIFTTVVPALFSIITFIVTTLIPAMAAGFFSIMAAILPIAISVGIILLKVLLAVAIVFLVLFAIWKAWAWLNKAFPEAMQSIKDFFTWAWEQAGELWDDFIDGAKVFWGWLETSATAAWDASVAAYEWLKENLGEVVGWLGEIFTNTWSWLESIPYVGEVFKWIKDVFFDLANNLYTLFFGDGPFLDRLVNFILDTQIFKTLATLGDWILGTFKAAWEMLVKTVDDLVLIVKEWIGFAGKAVDATVEYADSALDATVGFASAVGDGVVGAWDWAVSAFATGAIVTKPTLAMVGEGGDNEAVIPLNAEGMTFLANVLTNSDMFNLDSSNFEALSAIFQNTTNGSGVPNSDDKSNTAAYMNGMADISLMTYEGVQEIKIGLDSLYQYSTGESFNSTGSVSESIVSSLSWFAEGGIVRTQEIIGVGEEGPEMVIPLNDSGAQFVKSILDTDLYSGDNESAQKLNALDSNMKKLMSMMKNGRGGTATPINNSTTERTSNYVDFVAKGIVQ